MAERRKPPGPPPTGQVGKQPSSPGFLMLLAVMWIGAGIVSLTRLHAGWKLIPGIVFIGIGLLFLRGAATTVVRRDK